MMEIGQSQQLLNSDGFYFAIGAKRGCNNDDFKVWTLVFRLQIFAGRLLLLNYETT